MATAKLMTGLMFDTSQRTRMCAPVSLFRQLLSEEEVKAQLEAERQKSAQAASLWNHVSGSRGKQGVDNDGRERNLMRKVGLPRGKLSSPPSHIPSHTDMGCR